MSKRFEIFSNVDDAGALQKNVSQSVKDELKKHIGKRLRIIIERVGVTRSDRQNRYYWGVVVVYQIDCFAERYGEIWSKDEVHDYNKSNIWHSESIDQETGEMIKRPGSSKSKTKAEFEERLEKLRQYFFINFEWVIPLPNEQIDAF